MNSLSPIAPAFTRPAAVLLALLVALLALAACDSGASLKAPPVVVATLTPTTAAPPAQAGTAAIPSRSPVPTASAQVPATATQAPLPTTTTVPTAGRWIDVDVTRYVIRLMEGTAVLKTIQPVGVGEQIDTGAFDSTQTGLFYVYIKTPGLQYDAPYKTYISDWVGFDPAKANGFHSFLKDEKGNIVDSSTGRISNGCIRSGEAAAIFAFAEVGMPVLVHA